MSRSAKLCKRRMTYSCGSILLVLGIYANYSSLSNVGKARGTEAPVSQAEARTEISRQPAFTNVVNNERLEAETLRQPEPPRQTSRQPSLMHVCFTPEDSDEQLSRMIRSMRTILVTAKPETRERLVFHILGNKLESLDRHLRLLSDSGLNAKDIKVYRKATDLVPKKKAVHSTLKKLAKDEVYVRFFIPRILDKSVEKFLYLDTDTVVLSDLAKVYDKVLTGKYTLAAGVQNQSLCTLGKMLKLEDERLQPLGIKSGDKCLSGGAFFVDRWRWERENRTQRWQHWIAENFKNKLYYLGCMPPQMIDFHNQWEELPSSWLLDFKGHQCCPPKFSASLLSKSVIIHPFKDVKDAGDLKRLLDIDDTLSGYKFGSTM